MIHINQLHGGVNSVITAARQRYWIPSIRRVVRAYLRSVLLVEGSQETPTLPKMHLHYPSHKHTVLNHLVSQRRFDRGIVCA